MCFCPSVSLSLSLSLSSYHVAPLLLSYLCSLSLSAVSWCCFSQYFYFHDNDRQHVFVLSRMYILCSVLSLCFTLCISMCLSLSLSLSVCLSLGVCLLGSLALSVFWHLTLY